jgi:hypothetical protein
MLFPYIPHVRNLPFCAFSHTFQPNGYDIIPIGWQRKVIFHLSYCQRIERFDRGRKELRMSDRLNETIRLIQGLKRHQEARFSLGKGKEFKGDLTDDAEGPKGADQEFTHVVTGDILDCLPA